MGQRKLREHTVLAVVVVLALMFEITAASFAFAYGPPSATQTTLLGALVLVNLASFGWYAGGRRPRFSPQCDALLPFHYPPFLCPSLESADVALSCVHAAGSSQF